jgi:hypothetical protein
MSAAMPIGIEPSAGAAWAAIRKAGPHDPPIGFIVTGGNVSGTGVAGARD